VPVVNGFMVIMGITEKDLCDTFEKSIPFTARTFTIFEKPNLAKGAFIFFDRIPGST
jgi:hypothetical protein